MSNAAPSPLREADVLSAEQIALVRDQLEKVLSSRTLAGSRRTQDFLRLIVTHALEGETESLRERMIGAELFGRPVSYDTGNDSVVRVRASEVRRKLAQYYSNEAREPEPRVRIELPSGSYVPRFHFAANPGRGSVAENPPSVPAASPLLQPNTATPPEPQARPAEQLRSPRRSPQNAVIVVLVAACILLTIPAFIAFQKWRSGSAVTKGIHSIAVLPFDNLSGSASQDYFADGLTEELINDLGQVSTLRVISFTSSMSFKGTQKNLPEIAKDLSVEGIVEGGVLRDGNQVRISVQLIDARTDRPVWASTYVQDVTSVFAWQGEVAQSIAEEISTKVTPQEHARLERKYPADPPAQDLYLHGLLLRNASDCKRAIDDFQQAIARSPGYAQAHSALASCYGMLGESGQMPYLEAFSRQKAEALQAIALDDSLSEAHAELANTAMTLDWNWPVAAAEFRQALQLNPSSATNHEKYAFYLVRTGHPQEAIAEIEQSVELDPVSASTFHAEGFIYYFAHQYDQALAVTRTVRGLNIGLPDWNFLLGSVYAAKNQFPEAIRAFLQSGNGPYTLGHLGNAYARAGQISEARRTIPLLEDDVRRDGVGRYEIALVYAGLGDRDQAFQWLEDARQAHDVGLVYLRVDPCLDPLRSDPRFADLLQRIGLGSP
ncbi:MAG TPA: tetratricopeptide repeat protein [Acidobacteriaceae bacterium]|nr:tetratricopeptide repeat protein [Acidobacteriaceae bacterium]